MCTVKNWVDCLMIDHKHEREGENFFPCCGPFASRLSTKISSSQNKKIGNIHNTTTTQKKAHAEQIHVSAAARWVFARKEALLFALIVLPLLFDLLFSLIVVLE